MSSDRQVLVIDNGTGFTKAGYAGNAEPTFIVPTAVALADEGGGGAAKADGISDLDFFAGEEVRRFCGLWALASCERARS